MNYDKDILERVRRELENEKIRLEAEAESRRRQVYAALPRVAEIDAELRSSVLDIIRASFGKGIDSAELISVTRSKNEQLQNERAELLSDSGFDADFTEPHYSCEMCSDSGITGGELCPCVIKRYRKKAAEEINSKLRLRNTDFSKFELSLYPESGKPSPRAQMRLIYDFCRDWASGFGEDSENLYMSGASGLGKTFLASCMAQSVADSGFSVVYDTAFSILGAYEDVKFGRSENSLELFESCDLLVIDDVGSEMSTPFTVAAFFNLINRRSDSGKKTIVISALPKSEILKRYGSQMSSRLEGDFVKLEFLGDDVRLMR